MERALMQQFGKMTCPAGTKGAPQYAVLQHGDKDVKVGVGALVVRRLEVRQRLRVGVQVPPAVVRHPCRADPVKRDLSPPQRPQLSGEDSG